MNSLRLLLFGLAVCVLAALGWRLAAPPSRIADTVPPTSQPGPSVATGQPGTSPGGSPAADVADARRSVERRLAEVPQYAAFFARLGDTFPHVRENLINQWATRLARSGVLPSPETLVWQAARDVQQSQGLLAKHASDDMLSAYFDARLALLDAMAPTYPKLCADFLYGTTDSSIEAFSATHRDLVANLAQRQLAALKNGQDRKGDPAPPTSADLDLIASGLTAKGLSADETSMLLDGRTLDPPPSDTRLCDIGRIYLSVLRALPAEARARIYGLAAELLARS